ncbi:MAG: 6-phosphofructokinase [Desulfobacterales bacterium]|nr:6-phosphofructokinase [Desulfobacterales bacterium]
MEILLNHPVVKQVISIENSQIIDRRNYTSKVCNVFLNRYTCLKESDSFHFSIDAEARKQLDKIIDMKVQLISDQVPDDDAFIQFYTQKRHIGVVFSGGPAPGGHNVVAGIFDAAKKANSENRIFGFLLGPDGILENEYIEITQEIVDKYRNLGGFTMIKTGRTKIDSKSKLTLSKNTCKRLHLSALVIIGGDDSNTNAAFLAQEFYDEGIQVIGVPKTIDGDIQVRDSNKTVLCATSFGFYTAARAFAESVSRLSTDSSSDVKYWHICKVMGRVASHLALEVALQTHANMTLIGEELADYVDIKRLEKAKQRGEIDYTAYGMTLRHLSRVICDAIVRRAAVGKNYGVIVIPEGVLEFINEIQVFIIKLNTIIAEYNQTHDRDFHEAFPQLEDKLDYLRRLARSARENNTISVWNTRDDDLFHDIPDFFQEGLLMERDSHGNFQFSQIETDKIIISMVKDYLNILKEQGLYKIGIERSWYRSKMEESGLDADFYGSILFKNYDTGAYLLFKETIMSKKKLVQELVKENVISSDRELPKIIEKIYSKSVPKFKNQTHFFGYDGRGSDPTMFDCVYGYNLGLAAFSLLANKATGMMAAIKNLEYEFEEWQPIGIPIAPLMHLEERQAKLNLVIEKSLVNVNSNAFKVVKSLRSKWLAATPHDDDYRRPGPITFGQDMSWEKPISLTLNALTID